MTLNELFLAIEAELKSSSVVIPERQIEDLVGFHLGFSWSDIKLKSSSSVPDFEKENILKDMNRLVTGEPLAYVIGEKFFYKLKFKCDPRALIPRPETELLVEKALEYSKDPKKIMDIGAGTGCIGLSLANEFSKAQVLLVDASKEALSLSEENRVNLNLQNAQMIECTVGEDDQALNSENDFDLIVSNPPYIAEDDKRVEESVHSFEPHQALYTKEQGVYWIRLWLDWVYPKLKKDGFFLFEFGKNQEELVVKLVSESGFRVVEWVFDYAGIKRHIVLQK